MYICSYGGKSVGVFICLRSHSVVTVTIFMSAVKYMQCICRARVIVFNVPYVFPES